MLNGRGKGERGAFACHWNRSDGLHDVNWLLTYSWRSWTWFMHLVFSFSKVNLFFSLTRYLMQSWIIVLLCFTRAKKRQMRLLRYVEIFILDWCHMYCGVSCCMKVLASINLWLSALPNGLERKRKKGLCQSSYDPPFVPISLELLLPSSSSWFGPFLPVSLV